MKKSSMALACAFLGLLGSAHAASSASAKVGNLTFRLIDLNTNDGIEASFSFLSGLNVQGTTNLNVSASDAGNTDSASKIRNESFYVKTLTTSDLDHANATATVTTSTVAASGFASGPSTSFNASASTGSNYYYNYGALSLTANSVLIVTAEASVDAKATQGTNGCGYYSCYNSDNAQANASMSLNYSYSSGPVYTNYNFNDSVSTSAVARDGYYEYQYDPLYGYTRYVWVPASSEQSNSNSRTFSAVFTNSSSVMQYASLSLGANVTGYGTSAFPATPTTAVVPEADMLPMVFAGLGMVGFLVSRRRRA